MKPTLLAVCFLLSVITLTSCDTTKKEEGDSKPEPTMSSDKPVYAQRFSIKQFKNHQVLEVFNPWKGNSDTLEYLLVNRENLEKLGEEQRQKAIVTPVKRVVCLSTTHLGYLGVLEVENTIKGISGAKWSNNEKINFLLKEGEIREVGMNSAYNYETILDIQADVVFAFGINNSSHAQLDKLQELGVKVVLVSEFMENHPLGKSEWLRFFASFYEREELADLALKEIENSYNSLKSKVSGIQNRPSVFTGLPWKGDWYVPGGNSFQAILFQDAGAEYIWKDNQDVSGMMVDIEVVFDKALDADYWLNLNDYTKKKEVFELDERYAHFNAFSNAHLFNNNALKNENGGNDYWESGAVRPDLVLKDLVSIFHPDLLPQHELIYYRPLK